MDRIDKFLSTSSEQKKTTTAHRTHSAKKISTNKTQKAEIKEEVTTSHDTNSNKAVIEVNSKPKTRTYYYPSIKYTIDGQTYYNDLSTGSSDPDEYRVGDSINIRYNPDKPTEIDLGSASTKSGIFMALGCMVAGIIAGIAFIKVR